MISVDMTGRTVLITGGTKGIGRSSALEFARAGARTYLTFRWGSADPDELQAEFAAAGAPPPVLIQADVSRDEETEALLEQIGERESRIDIFISNVGVARRVRSLKGYRKKSFFKTLEYSTWPLIDYTRRIHERFGAYPARILGISSPGPDHFYPGYDFVAASKALLELFARYLSAHLFELGSRVNVVRFGPVKTESFDLIFGKQFEEFMREYRIPAEMMMTTEECGRAVFALCSGWMDALNGQIVTVDKGLQLQDNIMMRYRAYLDERKNGGGEEDEGE